MDHVSRAPDRHHQAEFRQRFAYARVRRSSDSPQIHLANTGQNHRVSRLIRSAASVSYLEVRIGSTLVSLVHRHVSNESQVEAAEPICLAACFVKAKNDPADSREKPSLMASSSLRTRARAAEERPISSSRTSVVDREILRSNGQLAVSGFQGGIRITFIRCTLVCRNRPIFKHSLGPSSRRTGSLSN